MCRGIPDDIINNCTAKHPEAAMIVVNQHVDFHTRENRRLDLCYSKTDVYKAYKLPPLGASDHNAVQLAPTYIWKHSKSKRKKISNTTLDECGVEQCRAAIDTTG